MCFLGWMFAATANAALLDGQLVRLGHDNHQSYSLQAVTVGSGLEFENKYFNVDIDDASIKVTFLQSAPYHPGSDGFNGFRLENNLSGTVPTIGGATVLAGTTLVGFSSDDILVGPVPAFPLTLLALNFAGLTPASGAIVHVGLSPVPEPTPLAMLVAGISALAWRNVRRGSSAA
jgi:hypothetical protein